MSNELLIQERNKADALELCEGGTRRITPNWTPTRGVPGFRPVKNTQEVVLEVACRFIEAVKDFDELFD
jgi:hypothetical protein